MGKNKIYLLVKSSIYLIGIILNSLIYYLIFLLFSNNGSTTISVINVSLLVLFVLYIIYKKENTSFQLSWVIFAGILPVTAIFMYLFSLGGFYNKNQKQHKDSLLEQTKDVLQKDSVTCDDTSVNQQVELVKSLSPFNAFTNSTVEYLEIGEKMHQIMLEEMKKAKKFIYLEYFIVSKSSMVDEILEVLFEKAGQGIEVKLMYDAVGSGSTVPKNLTDLCESNQVKCVAFNPFNASLYKYVSYRDHRKMTVIDGNVCISGGINLADEYVNRIDRFGHWKDTAVLVKGDAVLAFTTMFAKMWEFVTEQTISLEDKHPNLVLESESIVMPYGDGPDNVNNPAINLYISMINNAKKYIYLTTPYLILDDNVTNALMLSAKSGVDVRIIVPGIPDKKLIYKVTQSNYYLLLKSGVKIYEYKPGFIHCKQVIVDDSFYTVGSINFDFRSLFWNYECATWVYNSNSIIDVKTDFIDMISKSRVVKREKYVNMNFFGKLGYSVLKAISPLL